jgi:hypothetical protein
LITFKIFCRSPAVGVQNRPSLSAVVAGTTTAPTIQIAFRGPLDASSSLIPTTTVRLVTSIVPALQPKTPIVTENISRTGIVTFIRMLL